MGSTATLGAGSSARNCCRRRYMAIPVRPEESSSRPYHIPDPRNIEDPVLLSRPCCLLAVFRRTYLSQTPVYSAFFAHYLIYIGAQATQSRSYHKSKTIVTPPYMHGYLAAHACQYLSTGPSAYAHALTVPSVSGGAYAESPVGLWSTCLGLLTYTPPQRSPPPPSRNSNRVRHSNLPSCFVMTFQHHASDADVVISFRSCCQ
ncbi:hypothetical protein DENSPDRAFT_417796 [Dentipellis sp. KUC8613]|nr:hypothetical protein DENSPDRAFT_417796 [Dentipellis sp. KUC8613]